MLHLAQVLFNDGREGKHSTVNEMWVYLFSGFFYFVLFVYSSTYIN
jgi:hypothetical protein